MSKLYKNYILLKLQNSTKIYVFECGIFYIFIDADALIMSKKLNLKLTPLTPLISKCGFPINSSEKYFNLMKSLNYDFEIVSSNRTSTIELKNKIAINKYKNIIDELLNVNIDTLSVSQIYQYLHTVQDKLNKINTEFIE